MSCYEKISSHVFAGHRSHARHRRRVVQEVADPKRRPLDRMHDESGHFVDDLCGDPARSAANDRLAFPHGFRDGHPKTLLEGFLDHDCGGALKRVDFSVGFRGQLENMDVGVVFCGLLNLREHGLTLGIMEDPAAGEDQLAVMTAFG